jgi:hypothetical protein
MLSSSEDLIANLAKNKMNPILGQVQDASVQKELANADAVIDVELPPGYMWLAFVHTFWHERSKALLGR